MGGDWLGECMARGRWGYSAAACPRHLTSQGGLTRCGYQEWAPTDGPKFGASAEEEIQKWRTQAESRSKYLAVVLLTVWMLFVARWLQLHRMVKILS